MTRILTPLSVILGVLVVAGCDQRASAEKSLAAETPAASASAATGTGDVALAKATVVARPREVVVPAGTLLRIRLDEGVSSRASHAEDRIDATLVAPVSINQERVLPAGSKIEGYVVAAEPSGKVKGRARLAIAFRRLHAGGVTYPIVAQVSRVAPATKKADAEKIGIPAVGGALVGALVGGKKGAAIGAAAAGGAGTAVVLATPGKEVSLPRGSVLMLKLQGPVAVRLGT